VQPPLETRLLVSLREKQIHNFFSHLEESGLTRNNIGDEFRISMTTRGSERAAAIQEVVSPFVTTPVVKCYGGQYCRLDCFGHPPTGTFLPDGTTVNVVCSASSTAPSRDFDYSDGGSHHPSVSSDNDLESSDDELSPLTAADGNVTEHRQEVVPIEGISTHASGALLPCFCLRVLHPHWTF